MFHKWESTRYRIWQDTWKWLQNHIAAWFLVFIFPGVGTLLATLFIPGKTSIGLASLYGFLGGLVGLLLFFGIVYLVHVIVTPYRQRDEVRKQVEQYERERNNPKSQYYDKIAEEKTNKHFEELALLSEGVAARVSLPFSIDERYSDLSPEIPQYDDGIRVLMFININEPLPLASSKADWDLYPYLQTHILAEDSNWANKMMTLRESAVLLHHTLCAISQIATGVTSEWSIIIGTDLPIEKIVDGDLSPQVTEALKPMENDLRLAYQKCSEAMNPISEKLTDLAHRKTFNGKCPACP